MAELVIQLFELVDVEHDDGHGPVIALDALELFHDTNFKVAPIEHAREAIDIGHLANFFEVVCVLNRVGGDIGDRFQGSDVGPFKRVLAGALQRQHADQLAERNQRNANFRSRFMESHNIIW